MIAWLADVAAIVVGVWLAAVAPAVVVGVWLRARKPHKNEALIEYVNRRNKHG